MITRNRINSRWRNEPLVFVLAVCLFAFGSTSIAAADSPSSPNVLFIAIDDLRPALGCYDDPTAITPNIDRLANRGTVFNRAYCQQAVCSPSRLSLLTGRRPDTIQVWDLATHFRDAIPDVVTLPQHFKNHGYHTQSIGKIFHGSGKPSKDPPSWSVDPKYDFVRDANVRYALPENLLGNGLKRSAAESADVSDGTYVDGIVCDAAAAALADLSNKKQPFFLAVGFRKPHLPFCAPKKYWELYDRKKIPPLSSNKHPQNAPELATRSWNELEGYSDIPNDGRITIEKVRELRHGYYACVSYVDALVGRLLDELEKLRLADDTVVVLWGDHGFHLGEQGLWTKANNYELSTRVPLIISVPGQKKPGAKTEALVEFVDVYPTLADICGLDAPLGVEGVSLKPLLADPRQSWKTAVFSQFPRANNGNRHRGHGDIMGYAVRTDRYRYVQWQDWKSKQIIARELYDHQSDSAELINLADEPRQRPTVQRLNQVLSAGWESALPVHSEGIVPLSSPSEPKEPASASKPNVLFLAVDDMKDWVNCLGGYEGTVQTPNIERLAKRGMLFTNAHCPSPKCELAGWIAKQWPKSAPTKNAFQFDHETFMWTNKKTGETTHGKEK